MKNHWTQPSLSRDFALLSAAIIFLLVLISAWVTYTTYVNYSERINEDMRREAQRLGFAISMELDDANYILTALGKQIVVDGEREPVRLAKVIKAFDNNDHIFTAFSWVNAQKQIIISSSSGVLESPVDVSDRDYVQQSALEPWKMHIGQPIEEGRVSGRNVLPVSMGLTDYTGKFIGTLLISMDVHILKEHLNYHVRQAELDFAVVDRHSQAVLQSNDDVDFVKSVFPLQTAPADNLHMIRKGNLFLGKGSYYYFQDVEDYPYTILVGYNLSYSNAAMSGILWSRILQLVVISVFFVLFLWMMRTRMIRPVLEITAAASALSRGKKYKSAAVKGPEEIQSLSEELLRISEYIEENKRVDAELRNKIVMLRQGKESAEIIARSKSEFLAYVCQEIRSSLNHVIGFAQTMRDQMHGPIENRKYRQYSADIYSIGSTLLSYTQDLLSFSKVETGCVTVNARLLDPQEVFNKTQRFLADKLQTERRALKAQFQEPLPRLLADEFRLQQIMTNMVLYAIENTAPEKGLQLHVEVVSENRERLYYAVALYSERPFEGPVAAQLAAWAEELFAKRGIMSVAEKESEPNVHYELIRSLAGLHGAFFGTRKKDGGMAIAVFFPANCIRFSDAGSH